MKLSVVIPHLNHAKYLKDCLDSIRRQTFKDFEVILVDGGSTDDTFRILEDYPEIKVLKTNLNVPQALNKGIDIMTGDYFTQVNSDDILLPHMFETCMDEFKKDSSLGMVYTGWFYIDEENKVVGVPVFQPFVFDRNLLLKGNYIDSVGTVVPKKVLLEVGKFDERILYYVDWILAVKISKNYPVKYIEKPLFYYRKYPPNNPRYHLYDQEYKIARKIIEEEFV
jgi:alpha-1,3-rhamnosyltransferase